MNPPMCAHQAIPGWCIATPNTWSKSHIPR
jgi:hypothetical protein